MLLHKVDCVEYGLTDIQEYYANTGAIKKAAENNRSGRKVSVSVVHIYIYHFTFLNLQWYVCVRIFFLHFLRSKLLKRKLSPGNWRTLSAWNTGKCTSTYVHEYVARLFFSCFRSKLLNPKWADAMIKQVCTCNKVLF